MKQERFSRHLLVAFSLSLALYVFGYWFIESRRVVDTPWQVTFTTNGTRLVTVTLEQLSQKLGPVTVQFAETNQNAGHGAQTIRFDTPRPVPFPVPGGQCIFQDTTFLPGTVVLAFGTTKIQMIPRALSIGTNEIRWESGKRVTVEATSSLAPTP